MKFTCTVDINKPIEEVINKFRDENNLKEWQDGFESIEQLSGNKGDIGAQSRLIYSSRGRTINLIETITANNLPDEFSGLYEAKEMTNNMTNRFISLDEQNTRYTAEIEYLSFNGIMPKLMAFLFPGMFRKQVQKWLDQFKTFVETSK